MSCTCSLAYMGSLGMWGGDVYSGDGVGTGTEPLGMGSITKKPN